MDMIVSEALKIVAQRGRVSDAELAAWFAHRDMLGEGDLYVAFLGAAIDEIEDSVLEWRGSRDPDVVQAG